MSTPEKPTLKQWVDWAKQHQQWQHRVDTWSEALRAQAVLIELRDVGHIDSATCADECTKLYWWAMKETGDKENDDD